MNRLLGTMLALTGLLTTGCVGGDITVDSSWTVNGQTPNATVCANAGIVTVEVNFREVFPGAVADDFVISAACADGFASAIATIDNGQYDIFILGLDAGNNVVLQTEPTRTRLTAGDNAIVNGDLVPAANLTESLEVRVEFEATAGGTLDVTNCTDAKVAEFSYTLRDGFGSVVDSFSDLRCSDLPLTFGDNFIDPDTYSIEINASDIGAATWSTTCTGLRVDVGQDAIWTCDVEQGVPVDQPESLRVNVTFEETFGGSLDVVNCDTAKVSNFSYSIRNSFGTVVDQTMNLTCADLPLEFGDSIIDADTYQITVQANDNGSGTWDSTCTGLVVNEGEDATWTCDVEQI